VPLCHKVCMACNVCVGYEKCVLVGHDWGGAVAWSYAAVHPEHVECLIACNIPHPTAFKKHLRSTSSQARKSWYVFVSFHVIIIIINSNNNHNFLKWPQDNCNYCGDHWKMQGSWLKNNFYDLNLIFYLNQIFKGFFRISYNVQLIFAMQAHKNLLWSANMQRLTVANLLTYCCDRQQMLNFQMYLCSVMRFDLAWENWELWTHDSD